jgi:hypothetical protein
VSPFCAIQSPLGRLPCIAHLLPIRDTWPGRSNVLQHAHAGRYLTILMKSGTPPQRAALCKFLQDGVAVPDSLSGAEPSAARATTTALAQPDDGEVWNLPPRNPKFETVNPKARCNAMPMRRRRKPTP